MHCNQGEWGHPHKQYKQTLDPPLHQLAAQMAAEKSRWEKQQQVPLKRFHDSLKYISSFVQPLHKHLKCSGNLKRMGVGIGQAGHAKGIDGMGVDRAGDR